MTATMLYRSVLLAMGLAACAHAQDTTSTYVESGVPTGTPISGDYTGAYRPQIHYSPPKGFMVSPRPSFPI